MIQATATRRTNKGDIMNAPLSTATAAAAAATAEDRRAWSRRQVDVPGVLTWRDARGATRFASVIARDLSDYGAFVECETMACLPLYRLVTLQLDASAARQASVPERLRGEKVPAAVYRVAPPAPERGIRQGYALRLLIEPRQAGRPAEAPTSRAVQIA